LKDKRSYIVKLDDWGELWRNRRLLHKTPELLNINEENNKVEKNVINKEDSTCSKRITKVSGRYRDFKM
jgi:hypothetical protein